MNLFTRIYQLFMSFCIIMLIVFILTNVGSLNNITYTISFSSTLNFTFTLNFYSVVATIIAFAVIFTVIGTNVAASGLNDSTSTNLKETIAYIALFFILLVPLNYYLALIPGGSTINFLFGVVFLGHYLSQNSGGNN